MTLPAAARYSGTMPKRLPAYVQGFTDDCGKPRHYLRKRGLPRVALPGLPWSAEFMQAYASALAGERVERPKPPPVERVPAGSFAALIKHYKRVRFAELGEVTRSNYERLFGRLEADYGSLPVAKISEQHIQAIVDKRTAEGGIEAGNSTRRCFRLLMSFAKDYKYRRDNPAAEIRKKKAPKGTTGWDTLSEDNIARYFAKWPLGSRQHLAMTVLLYTGQRRGDVVRLGPHNIIGGAFDLDNAADLSISLTQRKTAQSLVIPLAPPLVEALKACKITAASPAFILTPYGQPYSDKSFTGKFSEWGKDAGIKTQCSPHTLRYAAARRLAELGCSLKVIAAVTGHQSLKELERYTRAAEQRLLAQQAIAALEHGPTG
ncbi:tyrosine-type recombinase/integrase [Bradyrhizobium sp.]|uniref:tyrosine-type recombinase/integrase n=1 Tax=Bradyrhizobium sp. TaxID=376 RepID=UPI003C56401A